MTQYSFYTQKESKYQFQWPIFFINICRIVCLAFCGLGFGATASTTALLMAAIVDVLV
jgi:hypothetical protein